MKDTKKGILSVLLNPFPPDIRVEKVCGGLLDAGYEVKILAQPNSPEGTRWDGRVVDSTIQNLVARYWYRIRHFAHSRLKPGFSSSRISHQLIRNCLEQENIAALHWNDLSGAHIGLAVAREMNVKFILDLHENYPYNIWSTERDLGIVSRKYSLSDWFRYEKYVADRADLIITSVSEMSERLNGMHFTPYDKMVEFLNAESPEFWDTQPQLPTPLDTYRGRDIICYVGSCSIHRGLDIIIEAVGMIKDLWPNVLFAIIGDGNSISRLKMLVKEKELVEHVLFLGRRPFSEVASYMRQSIIGVVPHYKYGQTDNTVPHKLFQYMCLRLPVLVSSCACLRRLVNESQSGLVFQSGNPKSAAKQLLRFKDKELRQSLSHKGRMACEGPYNLRVQQDKLLYAVKKMIGESCEEYS